MPEPLKILGTSFTPEVTFEPETNNYQITGYSRPENAHTFYKVVIDWFENNLPELKIPIQLDLKFMFMSTSSSKALMELFKIFEDFNREKHNAISINWHYDKEDEDMEETGEEYREVVDIPINMMPY